jgi:hypothetical protein
MPLAAIGGFFIIKYDNIQGGFKSSEIQRIQEMVGPTGG